jgi:site-specific recombinase XerD
MDFISVKGDSIMGRLRDQMQADLQLRGLSQKTQKAYIGRVRDFALYFKQSPEKLGEKEVKNYLLYIKDKGVSFSTINQCYSALRFLYRITLKRNYVVDKIPYPKTQKNSLLFWTRQR